MIGWRKLTAWFLIYALVAAATFLAKDISETAVDVITWSTGFFFGANALEHFAGKIGLTVGDKK